MSDDTRAPLDPVLHRARYGPRDDGDRFVGFWLNLVVDGRQQRLTPSLTRVRRAIEQFFAGREVRSAREALGDDAVNAQLRDAATVYFQTCLTDPNYSAGVWGMNRLQPEQLRVKTAKDAAGTLTAIVESRGATGPAASLPSLLVDGFVQVFGDPGRAALRDAVATKPALSGLTL